MRRFKGLLGRKDSLPSGRRLSPSAQHEPLVAGRGYAVEAMTAVCMHLRDEHSIRRIIADMDRRNEASVAVAQRLGMHEVAAPNATDRAFEWTAPFVTPSVVEGRPPT